MNVHIFYLGQSAAGVCTCSEGVLALEAFIHLN